MKRFGIKQQILMITLIPVFFIDLFFTYIQIDSNINQATELLQSRGMIIARQIAGASQYDLHLGDHGRLQKLLDQTVDSKDIMLTSIYDSQAKLVAKSESSQYNAADSSDYFYFRQPILSQSGTQTDVFVAKPPDQQQSDTLGWVHMYVSRQQLRQTSRQIIVDSITFFITILLMALILTVVISRKITQPIIHLMEHMKYVESGELGKSIEFIENNELGAVQMGFNRMTSALLANRRQLNQRIQQATQQLSEAITDLESKNRELGIARDEAQKADRTKSEFLANMSHEIRTPINGIKGFISLLSQSRLNNSQQRYVDIILKSTNDLTNIIDEILDFSKMESGKLQILEGEFDLHEILEQTRDILFINILAKNIDLNLIIFSDTPHRVIGDKLRLKQILLNLIGNAIKFTDHGQVVIEVSVEKETASNTDISISIDDSGIGISAKDQQNLFKAFSQVDSSDNRRFSGSGLGLVISKNLATLMGGDISMQSTPGQGSKFSLRLPFKIVDSKPAWQQSSPSFSALIFASNINCLMEVRSLFDRASVNTETSLLDSRQEIDAVRESIQRNLSYIDIIVFDLRHMTIDLNKIIDAELTRSVRVILMHYDGTIDLALNLPEVEFISVINSSRTIAKLLSHRPGYKDENEPVELPHLPHQSKKVLLVDDNQVNLKLASELIQLWGHRVVEADHGDKAFKLYQRQKFDLIILDIQMPGIDGASLFMMMREYNPADKTPVVALTANILNHQAEKLLELGFDYFLSKPIDEYKFRSLLDGNPRRQTADSQALDDAGNLHSDRSVDYEKSLALAANSEVLLKQILASLLQEIPEHQQKLMQALENQEPDKLAAIAHKLQGVSCYVGLPLLKQNLLIFQHQLRRDNNTAMQRTGLDICDELEAIKQQLEQYLAA